MTDKIKWACPQCSADLLRGFECRCESANSAYSDHGETRENTCQDARCRPCGWKGVFPPVKQSEKMGQLDFESALKATNEAVERVSRGADPAWRALAENTVMHLAHTRSSFTVDDVWHEMAGSDESTREPSALGAVMRELKSRGVIELTGTFFISERPSRHRAPLRAWKLTGQ